MEPMNTATKRTLALKDHGSLVFDQPDATPREISPDAMLNYLRTERNTLSPLALSH